MDYSNLWSVLNKTTSLSSMLLMTNFQSSQRKCEAKWGKNVGYDESAVPGPGNLDIPLTGSDPC